MGKLWRFLAAAAVLVVAGAWLTAGTTAQAPAARQIPGLTAKDAFPNGCVDCHVAGQDADRRLSVLLTKWTTAVPPALVEKAKAASADPSKIKGKHLAVPNSKANIPQSCMAVCHKKGSTIAPPFGQLLHLIHLTGATNTFLITNQGECTHCHKLDPKTGLWKVPSGSEK